MFNNGVEIIHIKTLKCGIKRYLKLYLNKQCIFMAALNKMCGCNIHIEILTRFVCIVDFCFLNVYSTLVFYSKNLVWEFT